MKSSHKKPSVKLKPFRIANNERWHLLYLSSASSVSFCLFNLLLHTHNSIDYHSWSQSETNRVQTSLFIKWLWVNILRGWQPRATSHPHSHWPAPGVQPTHAGREVKTWDLWSGLVLVSLDSDILPHPIWTREDQEKTQAFNVHLSVSDDLISRCSLWCQREVEHTSVCVERRQTVLTPRLTSCVSAELGEVNTTWMLHACSHQHSAHLLPFFIRLKHRGWKRGWERTGGNKIHGWGPFSCFGVRVLVLWVLVHWSGPRFEENGAAADVAGSAFPEMTKSNCL